jgi:hypothetical protein
MKSDDKINAASLLVGIVISFLWSDAWSGRGFADSGAEGSR